MQGMEVQKSSFVFRREQWMDKKRKSCAGTELENSNSGRTSQQRTDQCHFIQTQRLRSTQLSHEDSRDFFWLPDVVHQML